MTIIHFSPSLKSNFQFQCTLDQQDYTCIVTWNLFGQRYYINLYDNNGVRVLTLPLISSPNWYNINLVGGYFNVSTMVFREASQNFEILP